MLPPRQPHLTVSAQDLAPGQGGIGRVARLTVKALADIAAIEALAVMDRHPVEIGGLRSRCFGGSRWRFVLANAAQCVAGRRMIYDFAGTARAHLAGGLFGSRYAVWIHGYELWGLRRPDHVRAVRGADLILANSHYTLRRAQQEVGRLPQAVVCPLGTEEDDAPLPPLTGGPPVLLFVGRHDDLFAKGQDLLIEAWPAIVARIADARLVFAGGGPQLERLRDLVRASPAKASIDVLGFVPEDDMPALWRRASALAMLGREEGFGLVYIEAMRYGVPVIASTDDAGCEVNIDGVTGFNVSRDDRDGLVDRLLHVMSDRGRAAAIGRAGFERWQDHYRFTRFKERLQAIVAPWLTDAPS